MTMELGYPSAYGFENALFTIVPLIVIFGFVFVFGTLIFRGVQGAAQWKENNDSPVLTTQAKVVTKRAEMHRYHHYHQETNSSFHSTATTYYATFEFPGGDRLELKIQDKEYGLLVEQDAGMLTYQGTRYLGFERTRS